MPYQIILLEPGADRRTDELRDVLTTRFGDLNIDVESAVTFLDDATAGTRDRKSPVVAVYFGGSTAASQATQTCLAELIGDSVTVLPVVNDLSQYAALVPAALHAINGMEFTLAAPNYEEIGARVLELLALLRETRRLFISYKRTDSREAAIQLYELLDGKGFDVFLDTVSIRPAEPFQAVLAHRLADVDVIVLLHTRHFMESRWTIEELTTANALNVAILRLEWPEIRADRAAPVTADVQRLRDEEAALSVPFPLEPPDFDGNGGLTPAACARIADRVEALRARALAARQSRLTRAFAAQAQDLGFTVLPQPEGFLLVQKPDTEDLVAMAAVGAPSAVTYERFHEKVKDTKHSLAKHVYIVYDHRALLESHLKHLAWLDSETKTVRGVRITDTLGTLQDL
jgi:hypothetical protein